MSQQPARYRLVSVEVPAVAADACGGELVDWLGVGVSEERIGTDAIPSAAWNSPEDGAEEVPPLPKGAWLRLSIYLPDDPEQPDARAILERVQALLGDMGIEESPRLVADEWIQEENWVDRWREHARSIEVGEQLLIQPTWIDEEPAPGRVAIHLDPGRAFGAGSHISTRLALELLEIHLTTGALVADVGCGSGVLAIAAAKLGAERVVGVDIDPIAVEATDANAEANGVGARIQAHRGDGPVPVEGGYDLVVANITPPVLGQLMGSIDECLKPGGTFIASGIIEERAVEVLESARSRPRLELIERRGSEGWCGLAFRAGDNG
jgi:ribosomal protein L11 methyltransferase